MGIPACTNPRLLTGFHRTRKVPHFFEGGQSGSWVTMWTSTAGASFRKRLMAFM
jgi:hypothetical protein